MSVGALAGMSVLNLDSSKGSLSMSGGTQKIGGLRIRNKAIPIINPLVKNPNWPSTEKYKKGKSKYWFESVDYDSKIDLYINCRDS